MVIKFYHFDASPPSRAVKMTAKALNLPVEVVIVNLPEKEQNNEAFLKLNPTHTVPTIDDNGFVVWDSHAIVQYLAEKYGKNDQLYPKKFEERTLVNQMLFFDTSVLFPSLANAVRPIYYGKENHISQEKLDAIEVAFKYMETFLTATKFVASDRMTVADICAVATVSSIEIFHTLDKIKYPKLVKWYEEIKKMEFYKENLIGIEQFRQMLTKLLSQGQENM